ncbi:MAG: glycosyltransferase family 9 protein, partial [Bacteroidales bacterium]|nr:glycosyltransferase family 9 protein [Bacteroidales bacterium]
MKKILIIRFSSIGDIVLTTPVIRCLKQQLKDSEIHFLTKEQFVPIVKANPYIDKVHFIKNDLKQILSQLKSENLDFIVDLHKNFRSVFVKLKLRKPSKTFNKLNIKKWLLVNFKINLLPEIHIVDRYFKAVKILGVKNDGKGLDYFIPENEKVNISELPSTHQNGFIG